ncbi:MAG: methionyl-tRNA formyltransferase [Labilithrix sp.]|nr:methionyl-tRNA formyltransferase [Labilithrix sp.]MCW5814792.1 methionyl-tRNA formyltransferase [Labilithrix sp.]
MTFRAVFFGTPQFAVPCLDALAEIAEVTAVVCQPDRPQGRGLELHAPPVKERALALGITVHQPTKVRTGELARWLKEQGADVALVVAYGRILPKDVLDAPRLGCVNVHASLLPKLRGAAPITWAVVRGEPETGITLMKMDEGMDTGPMLELFRTPIDPDETAGELSERLAAMGALAVRKGLPKYVAGEYVPIAQNDAEHTVAPMLKKEDGRIDFTKHARAVHDHVRGMSPWPGAFTTARGKTLKVHATRVTDTPAAATSAAPGTVVLADKSRVVVACGARAVELARVQLEGKKPVSASDWYSGRGVIEGDVLGAAI